MNQHIKIICDDLDIPEGDKFTQDWEYELPEEYRTFPYFKKYFQAYIFNNYQIEVKQILINLMIDICNDYMENNIIESHSSLNGLNYIIQIDYPDLKEIISYWANENEPLEDSFAISQFMREVIASKK